MLHQWQVFCDDDFQETKTVHLLHFSSSTTDRGVFSTSFLLKWTRCFPIYSFTYKYIRLDPLCCFLINITVKYHKTISIHQAFVCLKNYKDFILHCTDSAAESRDWNDHIYIVRTGGIVTSEGSNTHSCDHVHQFSEAWTSGQLWSMTLNQPSENYHSMQHGALCKISPSWQRREGRV